MTALTLAIETSSRAYAVAIGDADGTALYRSADHFPDYRERDLTPLVQTGLARLDADSTALERIAVNHGPGGLGAIRAGVAFANALGFALGAPVIPILSFELLAREARGDQDLPVLCLRKAADGRAYAGLMRRNAPPILRFGPIEAAARDAAADVPELLVAGTNREEASALLPQARVGDSGVDAPDATTLLTVLAEGVAPSGEPVLPINEFSPIFEKVTA